MYLDSVVVLGLIIIILSCVMITYVGIYAYKHIKADIVADRTGLEPATSGVTGRHSNRLNYRSAASQKPQLPFE